MKKSLLALGLVTVLAGCSDNEVGDVSLGMFTMNDLHSITQPF
ncbi:TPA: membrane lipoprotein lipid attachment site-containing protein [Vibrio harveyi]|nr:membrane lipoprotein lipid attachment site-containing protein [Vibrio harveyi]